MGIIKLWSFRICNRYFKQLWIYHRESSCSSLCTSRTRILADCRCPNCRNCSKRSRCIKLQRFIWGTKHYNYRWYEYHGCNTRRSWIRGSKCLCTDGILPSLYPVYCYHRNDQPGSREQKTDSTDHFLPVCCRMGYELPRIPYRTVILIFQKYGNFLDRCS